MKGMLIVFLLNMAIMTFFLSVLLFSCVWCKFLLFSLLQEPVRCSCSVSMLQYSASSFCWFLKKSHPRFPLWICPVLLWLSSWYQLCSSLKQLTDRSPACPFDILSSSKTISRRKQRKHCLTSIHCHLTTSQSVYMLTSSWTFSFIANRNNPSTPISRRSSLFCASNKNHLPLCLSA